MAARAYLSRIARPTTAADPQVWSIPRAPADLVRPAVDPGAAEPAARRARPEPSPPAAPVSAAPAAARPDNAPPPSQAPAALAPAPVLPASPVPRAPAGPDAVPPYRPRRTPEQDDAVGAAPARRETVSRPAVWLRDDPPASQTAPPAAGAPQPEVSKADAAARLEALALPARPSGQPAQRAARATAALAEPRPAAANAANRSAAAPRLEIGTLEVRIAAPPPPAPLPPPPSAASRAAGPAAATAPLARPYAWRYGLLQG